MTAALIQLAYSTAFTVALLSPLIIAAFIGWVKS